MGPIGHFAVGMIFGIIIVLPYLKDRLLYDYDKHKWVHAKWESNNINDSDNYYGSPRNNNETHQNYIIKELNPLTRSKLIPMMPVVMIICGLISLVPDISHLWGNASLDQTRFADLFFFHYSLDAYFSQFSLSLTDSLMIEVSIILFSISVMISLMAVSHEMQFNRHNYENYIN